MSMLVRQSILKLIFFKKLCNISVHTDDLLDHDPSTHQWLVLLEGTVISSSYKIDRMLNVIFINIHHQTYNKNIIDIITLLNSTMWIVTRHTWKCCQSNRVVMKLFKNIGRSE